MLSRAVVINVCSESKKVSTVAELLKTGFGSASDHVVVVANKGKLAKVVATKPRSVGACDVSAYVDRKLVAHWLKWQLISIDALINVASNREDECHGLASEPLLPSLLKFARGSITDIYATENVLSESLKLSQLNSQLFAQLKIPHNTIVCDMKQITQQTTSSNVDTTLANFVWNVGEASRVALITGVAGASNTGQVHHFNAASAVNLTQPLSSSINLSYWNDIHAV